MQSLLLVEDNPHDLDLALLAFEAYAASITVATARDGEEALDFLNRRGKWTGRVGDTALVLMDLRLPELTGLDVLQEIRHTPSIASVPVVALTSSREPQDLRRCYESGINAFLVKPMGFAAFSQMISVVASVWLGLNRRPSNVRVA
ncbi:response regulator [Caballeronia cordobensis]|uniref:response regulator n=1 Tax=Caballeronia cordobensis TaxID=1353886 RepID=UPI0006AD7DFE|nr:response regulator [Caballeronia cordobensis]